MIDVLTSTIENIVAQKNELEGLEDGEIPAQMFYDGYDNRIVCKWGVELLGWTEEKIENPAKITTVLGLR